MRPFLNAGFGETVGLVDLALLPRNRALSLSVSGGLARALRVLAVLAAVVNWAWLIAVGR